MFVHNMHSSDMYCVHSPIYTQYSVTVHIATAHTMTVHTVTVTL